VSIKQIIILKLVIIQNLILFLPGPEAAIEPPSLPITFRLRCHRFLVEGQNRAGQGGIFIGINPSQLLLLNHYYLEV
jgi:hypothetical protein